MSENKIRKVTIGDVADMDPADAMRARLPGAIERSEQAGQVQLVESDVLPIDLHGEDALFEQLGFVLGASTPGDDLFRWATLPKGWTKQASEDNAFHSFILDEQGRKRVAVFYKAAFYDRRADAHLRRRYSMRLRDDDPSLDWDDRVWTIYDEKNAVPLFEPPCKGHESYRACEEWAEKNPETGTLVEQWSAP